MGHDRASDPRLADRCPRPDDIACLLDDSKISASSVAPAPNRQWGSTRYVATGSDGETLRISLYGRDAGLSQLPADTYRTVVYHRHVGPFALTRVQQIEHEAYMTLLAQRATPGRTAAPATTGFAGPSHEAVVVSISPKCRVLREMLAVGGAPCGRAVPRRRCEAMRWWALDPTDPPGPSGTMGPMRSCRRRSSSRCARGMRRAR